jgi:hypothetical protein
MWKPIEIGTVVAERKLTFQSDDLQKSVTLVVGQPVRSDIADESDPWWCPIQLRGLDDRVHSIAGEDSLQALVLALEFARTLLTTTAKDDGGTVSWEQDDLDCVTPSRATIEAYSPPIEGLTQPKTHFVTNEPNSVSRQPQSFLREASQSFSHFAPSLAQVVAQD